MQTELPTCEPIPSGPWWRQLNRYHWFVFMVASLAWLFDCLDQQLFLLARNGAMKALLPAGMDVKLYGGYATTIFVAGWATGGLIFGAVGDRIGRAKTLAFTVLLYSVCTGLSAFSKGWVDFALYRFATGLGVGGVFGLAVALVADSLPEHARPGALGLLQALSAIGNITAGSIAIILGNLEGATIPAGQSWKYMFLDRRAAGLSLRLHSTSPQGAGEVGQGPRGGKADRREVRLVCLALRRGPLAQARAARHDALRGGRRRPVGRRLLQPGTGRRCHRTFAQSRGHQRRQNLEGQRRFGPA